MLQLVVEEEDRTLAFPLVDGEHVIGSGADCQIRLGHPTVSRRHARLRVSGENCTIEDLGSRNGLRVAGRRVAGSLLAHPGDEMLIGTQKAKLEEVAAEDLEPAVRFGTAATVFGAGSRAPTGLARPTTAASGSLESFALTFLPRLLDKVENEAPVAETAHVVGAALFETLPCLAIRIEATGGGVLFDASRVEGEPAEWVRVEHGPSTLVVGFAHATQARGFRPLIESCARLLALASGRRLPGSPPAVASSPPLPDPPSVDGQVRRIYRDAARVARGDVSVLITGESGTGKELLARYLHDASKKSDGPFVALNCAALPSDLLEAELFGIEARVATGVDSRPGRFELADGGTLLLDEIGDMAAATQAKILRVLQEGEIYRIGGRQARRARVRVLAATNRDLEAMIEEGSFRTDLYHRIADWTVKLPPLRDRAADVPQLAAYFLEAEAERLGLHLAGISRAAMEALSSYGWPGNVRQLEREMARVALFLDDGQLLQVGHLQDSIRQSAAGAARDRSLRARLEVVERREIQDTLRRHAGNISAVARELELARSTLYRRIEELGLEESDWT